VTAAQPPHLDGRTAYVTGRWPSGSSSRRTRRTAISATCSPSSTSTHGSSWSASPTNTTPADSPPALLPPSRAHLLCAPIRTEIERAFDFGAYGCAEQMGSEGERRGHLPELNDRPQSLARARRRPRGRPEPAAPGTRHPEPAAPRRRCQASSSGTPDARRRPTRRGAGGPWRGWAVVRVGRGAGGPWRGRAVARAGRGAGGPWRGRAVLELGDDIPWPPQYERARPRP